ncbi:hypothetical protein D9M70_456410 [compost metagenome]
MPMSTPIAMSSLRRADGWIWSSTGSAEIFWQRPPPIARTITPSSSSMTCICGLSLAAVAFARISAEVPGTTTTLTSFAFSKGGSTCSV